MHSLRNGLTKVLIVIVAVINSLVLIIKPVQFDTVLADYEHSSKSERYEDTVISSYAGDYSNRDQQIPKLEIGISLNCVEQPRSNLTLFYESYAPLISVKRNISGSSNPLGAKSTELNRPELIILHRRLNT